jgi:peroxiredoxin
LLELTQSTSASRPTPAWLLLLWRASWGLGALLVVALAVEVRQLRPLRSELLRQRTFPHAGQWLPTTRVASLDGDSLTIAWADEGQAQVLIGFTTTCPYCRESMPKWRALASRVAAIPGADVLWVSGSSVDSTRDWATREAPQHPVVRLPDAKTQRVMRFHTVPLTVVVDRYGRVVYSHSGAVRTTAVVDSVVDAVTRARALDSLRAARTPRSDSAR